MAHVRVRRPGRHMDVETLADYTRTLLRGTYVLFRPRWKVSLQPASPAGSNRRRGLLSHTSAASHLGPSSHTLAKSVEIRLHSQQLLLLVLLFLAGLLPGASCRRLLQTPPEQPGPPDPPEPPPRQRSPPPPPPASVGTATTSLEFFQLLYSPNITEIRVLLDLKLTAADAITAAAQAQARATAGASPLPSPSSPAAADAGAAAALGLGLQAPLRRTNATVVGASRGTATQLDFNFLSAIVRLGPGVTLTFRSLEVYKALNHIGQTLDFVGKSEGGAVVLERCVQRRAACVPYYLAVAQILSLPPAKARLDLSGTDVTLQNESSFCWSTATLLPTCKPRSIDVGAASVNVPLQDGILADSGGYDVFYRDSHIVCDFAIDPECLNVSSAERCLSQELVKRFGGGAAPAPVKWLGDGSQPGQGGGRVAAGDADHLDGPSALTVGLAAGLGGFGVLLLLALAVAAVILVRRRRAERLRQAGSTAAGAAASSGYKAGSSSTDNPLRPRSPLYDPDGDPAALPSSDRQTTLSADMGIAVQGSRKGSAERGSSSRGGIGGGGVTAVGTSSSSRGTSSGVGLGVFTGGPDSGRVAKLAVGVSAAAAAAVGSGGASVRGPSVTDPWDIESVRRSLFSGARSTDAPINVQLLQMLGEGSFGKVYKGIWQGTVVALKVLVLSGHLTQDQRRRQMAVMEAAISSAMSHPNIVQTYTYSFRPIRETRTASDTRAPSSGSTARGESRGEQGGQGAGTSGDASAPGGGASPPPGESSDTATTSRIYGHELLLVLEYCDRGSLRQALDAGLFHRLGGPAGTTDAAAAPAGAGTGAPAGRAVQEDEEATLRAAPRIGGPEGGKGGSDGGEDSSQRPAYGGRAGRDDSFWLTPATEFSKMTGQPRRPSLSYAAGRCGSGGGSGGDGGSGRRGRSHDDGGGGGGGGQRRGSPGRGGLEGGAYNYGLMLQVTCDVASALLHLHSHGVVHGDIKASNVLLKTAAQDERRLLSFPPHADLTLPATTSPDIGAPPRDRNSPLYAAASAPAAAAAAAAAAAGPTSVAGTASAGGRGGRGGVSGPSSASPPATIASPSATTASSAPGALHWNSVGLVAKVADFGLSTVMGFEGDAERTHISALTAQGSLTHMAPELMLHGHISKRVDVYAFGILLFELFTGERAYRGVPRALLPHQVAMGCLRPSLPPYTPADYRALAEACWQPEPTRRPTFEAILRDLTRMQAVHAAATAAASLAAAATNSRATSSPASVAASPGSTSLGADGGGVSGPWPSSFAAARPDGWVLLPSLEASTCSSTLFAELVRTSGVEVAPEEATAPDRARGTAGGATAAAAVAGAGAASRTEAAGAEAGGAAVVAGSAGGGGACGDAAPVRSSFHGDAPADPGEVDEARE